MVETYEQGIKLSQFLMDLNNQYTAIRGQILMMNPLPTLNVAYALLLQEENQRTSLSMPPLTNEVVAMSIKPNLPSKPIKYSNNKQPHNDSTVSTP